MQLSEFDYPLDNKNIAQTPASPRDSSKLLITHSKDGSYTEETFRHIKDYLTDNDVLVINNTQAIRARLRGYTVLQDGKKKEVEVVLLTQQSLDTWECAVFPGERLKPGKAITFLDREGKESNLTAKIEEITYSGRIVKFNQSGPLFWASINHVGYIPLPPYIRIPFTNIGRYNTVYAKNPGSAAAPTAGLHFTKPLLEEIKKK